MTSHTSIIIYGASGDLNHRKLMPALFNLFLKKRLPQPLSIIGLGRHEWDTADFRKEMGESVQEHASRVFDEARWSEFAPMLHYVQGDFTEREDYDLLQEKLAELEGDAELRNRLFYLAMPPRFYESIVTHLGETGLVSIDDGNGSWRRVIIEKPFGHDLASARELNRSIHRHLREEQIYRIDHYLAKETVQNIMVFRFGNSIFEPLWNRHYIDHVQITAVETVDVSRRASYYDAAGVLRDMFQNHLMQLLSIVTMEPPSSHQAEALRNEKVKSLSAVRCWRPGDIADHTVRGQYAGYQEAEGVPAGSETATFGVLRLFIDNWRWKGVPFYIRSGKALAEKLTEITIQFKAAPVMLFAGNGEVPGNTLTLTIQPDEGIHLRVEAKTPDKVSDMQPVNMHFHYGESFEGIIPEAYERLLADAFKGDTSLFARDDEVERAWEIIDPVMAAWSGEDSAGAPPLAIYEPGSWGPIEADEFLAADRRAWVNGAERPQIVVP